MCNTCDEGLQLDTYFTGSKAKRLEPLVYTTLWTVVKFSFTNLFTINVGLLGETFHTVHWLDDNQSLLTRWCDSPISPAGLGRILCGHFLNQSWTLKFQNLTCMLNVNNLAHLAVSHLKPTEVITPKKVFFVGQLILKIQIQPDGSFQGLGS